MASLDDSDLYTSLNELRKLQYQARGFSFLPHQPANSVLSGKNSSKLRGRGLNFEELRHYKPGDDIRSMDWKTTKRTGKPHIKVYTEERERNVYLIIDQRSSMFFGSTGKMKSVVAAELGALIAWRIVDSGDRIGAVVFNDATTQVLPARRGRQHVVSCLTELVQFNHQLEASETLADPSVTLNQCLEKVPAIVGQNALVILITDGYGWDANTTASIKKARQHNEVIACTVQDALELKLPVMSQMVVSDGGQQIQFASSDTQIRQRYQQALEEQLSGYERVAKRYRIPFIGVNTTEPVHRQLRKALGAS